MSEDRSVQYGMTEADQETYANLVKGNPAASGWALETIKLSANREVGQNLREVVSKTLFDLLTEHGLVERAETLWMGHRINAIGMGAQDLNRVRGTGGDTTRYEHLYTFYKNWSSTVMRRLGPKYHSVVVNVIFIGHSINTVADHTKQDWHKVRDDMLKALSLDPEQPKIPEVPPTLRDKPAFMAAFLKVLRIHI